MKKHTIDCHVQFDSETGEPVVCGDTIQWFRPVQVVAWFRSNAEKAVIKDLEDKHPMFKGFIQVM